MAAINHIATPSQQVPSRSSEKGRERLSSAFFFSSVNNLTSAEKVVLCVPKLSISWHSERLFLVFNHGEEFEKVSAPHT